MSKYWGVEEDELVLKWNECTTQREEMKITKLLIPSINQSINNILQIYFSINYSYELKQDCLMHVLFQLKTIEIKNNNIFGLVGFIIKNYFKNKTYQLNKADQLITTSTNYYSLDDVDHITKYDVQDNVYSLSEDIEELNKAILSHLNALKIKMNTSIEIKIRASKSNNKVYVLSKHERVYLDIIDVVINFLQIDKDKWDLPDLFEYVILNRKIKICDQTLTTYINEILGIDAYYKLNEAKDTQTKIFNKYNTNYIDDDFTPDYYHTKIDIHRKYSKRKSNCIIKSN